jgi:glycerophosphoryl diester phosphodiesterase
MDLRLSADGELMVIHDDTVARTTEGTGRVEDLTAGQMQALDNAYWFVPDCWSCHDRPSAEYLYRGVRTGEVPPPAGYHADDFRIPTLREVLEAFPDRLLDLEIKVGSSRDGDAARALAAMLREYGRTDDVIVVSFGDDVLREFHDAAPEVATSPGLAESTAWFFDRRPLPGRSVLQVPPTYSGIDVVTPAMVADAHAVGLAVWVWLEGNSQENEAFYSSLLDMGVDGIIASKPVVMERTLRRRGTVFTTPVTIAPAADPAGLRGNRLPLTLECPERVASRCEGDLTVSGRAGPDGRTAVLGRLPVHLSRGERADAVVKLSAWAGAAPRAGATTLLDVTIDAANADTGGSSVSLPARR